MKIQETDFICSRTILSEGEREQFASVTDALFANVQETRELENGFAFRIHNQPGQLVEIAKFIERESQCCSFLHFKLEVEPTGSPVWLHITGEDGAKEFLFAELDQIRNLESS
jgi:hypothetical protein